MDKVIFNNVWKQRMCNPIFNIINAYISAVHSYKEDSLKLNFMSKEIILKFQEANKRLFNGESWDSVKIEVFETDKYPSNANSSYEVLLKNIFVDKKQLEFETIKNPIYYTDKYLYELDYSVDFENNLLKIKYDNVIKFDKPFRLDEFQKNGNSELYMVFPYFSYYYYYDDKSFFATKYNPVLGEKVRVFDFIALKITDINGDGDIKFDHIDKIDYIDTLNITLKVPYAL